MEKRTIKLVKEEKLRYKDLFVNVYNDDKEVDYLKENGMEWSLIGQSRKGQKMVTYMRYHIVKQVWVDEEGNEIEEFVVKDNTKVSDYHKAYRSLK